MSFSVATATTASACYENNDTRWGCRSATGIPGRGQRTFVGASKATHIDGEAGTDTLIFEGIERL